MIKRLQTKLLSLAAFGVRRSGAAFSLNVSLEQSGAGPPHSKSHAFCFSKSFMNETNASQPSFGNAL